MDNSKINWKNYKDELPPIGVEVLAFHSDWVNIDFNPTGTRIGFQMDDDFVSAYWWAYQDSYMSISHSECDDNPLFSEKTRNTIDPEKWISLESLINLLNT